VTYNVRHIKKMCFIEVIRNGELLTVQNENKKLETLWLSNIDLSVQILFGATLANIY